MSSDEALIEALREIRGVHEEDQVTYALALIVAELRLLREYGLGTYEMRDD